MTGMQNRKVKTKKAVEVIWKLFANHESMKGTKETNIKKKCHSGKHALSKGFCL